MSSTLLEAIKLLNSHTKTKITESEDDDWDEEEDWEEEDEYETLSDYLGYDLRAKIDNVYPNKPEMLYVTQERINSVDFLTILRGIAKYYGKAVDGKEYKVKVYCRSYYPGSDFGYFIAKVRFNNGLYEILPGEEIELVSGDVQISICKDNPNRPAYYCIECKAEDITGIGSTLQEAGEDFLDTLAELAYYADVDDGYAVSRNTLDIFDENYNLTTIDGMDLNEFNDAETEYQKIGEEVETGPIVLFEQIEYHTYEEPITNNLV